jgi:hypothetical protein
MPGQRRLDGHGLDGGWHGIPVPGKVGFQQRGQREIGKSFHGLSCQEEKSANQLPVRGES